MLLIVRKPNVMINSHSNVQLKINFSRRPAVQDFLYNNPKLYEEVFPSHGKNEMCIELFEEHMDRPLESILDIACGTGRDLEFFAKSFPYCAGFDINSNMIAYAKERNPNLHISVGDMLSHRLNRQFSAICALGASINFALTNEELEQTIETYRVHAEQGTILVVQLLNSNDFFGQFLLPETFTVPYLDSQAIGRASYNISGISQTVERTRNWTVESDGSQFSDTMKFRVIFPAELTYFLSRQAFEVIDIFERPGGSLYTTGMFLVARYLG